MNQSLAQRHWHGQDPLGRRISFDDGKTWTQIVGVVGDVRERGLDQAPSDLIYLPYAQYPQMSPSLVARTQGDPMNIARAVVQHLYEVDPNQPAGRIQSLEQVRADSIAAPRLTANLLGLFALLALAIAAAGIGGVMALAVSQRTHEIGVRMAIGARPAEIVLMILRQGMALAIVGVALGVLGAFALTHAAEGFTVWRNPTDPVTFVGVAAVLSAAALAACYIPARRAAQIDPLRACARVNSQVCASARKPIQCSRSTLSSANNPPIAPSRPPPSMRPMPNASVRPELSKGGGFPS